MTPSWCGFISAPHRPGTALAACGPRLSCAVTGRVCVLRPQLHLPTPPPPAPPSPLRHRLRLVFPSQAVCDWYKPDRRQSSRGSASRRRPGRRALRRLRAHGRSAVYPPGCRVRGRRRRAAAGGGCRSQSPVASTWLCGRGALCSPACPWVAACWGQRNQARRRKSISHAMLPSPARPSCAVGFTRVKFKESQQRQLSGLPRTGITASPPQAGIFLGLHLPAVGLCSPGEAPSFSRRGLGGRPGRATGTSPFPGSGRTGAGGPTCP